MFLILSFGFQCVQASGQVVATWTDSSGNWSNPANWSTLTVPNGDYNVTINVPGSVVAVDLPVTADTMRVGASSSLHINAGAFLVSIPGDSLIFGISSNSGTLINSGGLYLLQGRMGSEFINFGTLTNTAGFLIYGVPTINSGVLKNFGVLSVDGGCCLINTGTIVNGAKAAIAIDNGSLNSASSLMNKGTIDLQVGTLTNTGKLTNSGAIVLESQAASVGNYGLLSNTGTIGILAGPCGGGGVNGSGAVLNNSGTMYINVGISHGPCGAGFGNSGIFDNKGVIDLGNLGNGGTLSNSGTLLNSGKLTIFSSALLATSTNYTQKAGSTVVDGTLTATNGAIVDIKHGSLIGSGTINGNVLMGGTLMPEANSVLPLTGNPGDATPGTLTIFGDYEQTHTGTFDELLSPSSHSLLDVNGKAVLDHGSELEIALLNGFNPIDQTFDIMDYSSLTGVFANGSSFWDDGFLWDVTYGPNQIDITAIQAQAADPPSPTPEPSSFLLLGLGALTFSAFVRRHAVPR
jgi:hypothetical protein